MNFIHNITIYPASLKGNQLDPRMDFNKPFMMICFDHIVEPETDERIIKAVEQRFKDLPVSAVKLEPVREILTSRREITSSFKEKISLS